MVTPQKQQEIAALHDAKINEINDSKQKWTTKKIVSVIVGVLLFLVVGFVLLVNAATSAPVKVSNELVANIQSKNSTAAYNLLSSAAKNVVDPQEFATTIDQIGPILSSKPKMESKEIFGETGSAATAKVTYKIRGNDDIDYRLTVNLIKDEGEWRVQNFESKKVSD